MNPNQEIESLDNAASETDNDEPMSVDDFIRELEAKGGRDDGVGPRGLTYMFANCGSHVSSKPHTYRPFAKFMLVI